MDDCWILAMQEGNSITNRNDPAYNTCQRNNFIAQAHYPENVGEISALDIAQYNVVTSTLIKCYLESWQAWMVQLTKYACLMFELCFSACPCYQVFFNRVLLIRLQV
jgi:hypothetical protein